MPPPFPQCVGHSPNVAAREADGRHAPVFVQGRPGAACVECRGRTRWPELNDVDLPGSNLRGDHAVILSLRHLVLAFSIRCECHFLNRSAAHYDKNMLGWYGYEL